MALTRFSRLARSVRRLGVEPGPADFEHRLRQGRLDVCAKDLVLGAHGIYWLGPEGRICRVAVHRHDIDIDGLSGADNQASTETLMSGGFDRVELLQQLPRVFYQDCDALQAQLTQGRWVASRRLEARYYVTYFAQGSELLTLDQQPLLAASSEPALKPAFLQTSPCSVSEEKKHSLDCPQLPMSISDWQMISQHYAELVHYQCQAPRCPKPNLNTMDLNAFWRLHLLRDDADGNVWVAGRCPRCHQRDSGHRALRDSGPYIEYHRHAGLALH